MCPRSNKMCIPNHVHHLSFHQHTGEACFQSSPVFPICTGKRTINNRLQVAIGCIQGVNVSYLVQDGPLFLILMFQFLAKNNIRLRRSKKVLTISRMPPMSVANQREQSLNFPSFSFVLHLLLPQTNQNCVCLIEKHCFCKTLPATVVELYHNNSPLYCSKC